MIEKKEWYVIFSKGDRYNQESKPIHCATLEEAFGLIEEYTEQIMFDDLMRKLEER